MKRFLLTSGSTCTVGAVSLCLLLVGCPEQAPDVGDDTAAGETEEDDTADPSADDSADEDPSDSSDADSAGVCQDPGGDCSNATCCSGLTCVDFDENGEQCAADCDVGGDCAACCCAALQSGAGVCVEGYCQGECTTGCGTAGSLCVLQGDCCGFADGSTLCVSAPELGEGLGACSATCDDGSDCASGCCADLEGGDKACRPATSCGG